MAGGLIAALEAVVLMTGLGLLHQLRVAPVALLSAGFILLHLVLSYSGRGPAAHRAPRFFAPIPVAAALALAIVVVAFRLWLASRLPVDSWDALSYHVPMIWRWLEQGSLDLAGSMGPSRYYPWDGELFAAWLALLNGRSLDPVRTSQAYPLVLMACAGAVLGRRLAGRRWAGAVFAALLALPIAVYQAGEPYVDVFYAAYWVCAAAAALSWDRCGRPVHLVLWGAAFGLALGSKATVYFQAPLVLQVLATLLLRPRRRESFRRAVPLAAAAALAGGAFCYARNWIQNGNPIYPYTFKLAGRALFSGIMQPQDLLVTVERRFVSSTAEWLTYPFRETMKGEVYIDGSNGFGALFAAGWLLFAFALAKALRRRDWGAAAFLALLPGACFFFINLQPTREPRYMCFLPALAISALAYLLSRLKGWPRSLAFSAWAFGLSWGLLGALGGLEESSGIARGWQVLRSGRAVDPHQYYRWQFGPLGELWAALNARLETGDVVAVNYGELVLPLAGLPPRGRIVEVGHAENDFPETWWSKTDAGWVALLDSLNVKFVVVWSPAWYTDVGKAERGSIARFPERFKPLGDWQSGGMGKIALFELLPAPEGAVTSG
jgi:hypothetical protein